ncbi:polyhydroxyalkanoate granule-associated phasin [Ottowia sp.]|uniref:polyhydroxyalkanoate granule-associated phasin n=1 Tax=Ottowia sp. TaxID=1898956 RepID=UPI003A8A8231
MTSSKQYKLSRRSGELAQAVPQVVAMRMGRMMGAGWLPAASDQQEFFRMGAEKFEAFGESWQAMMAQTALSQQQFANWWIGLWWGAAMSGWTRWPTAGHVSTRAGEHWANAMLDIGLHGLAPVHRRAVNNARRLEKAAR